MAQSSSIRETAAPVASSDVDYWFGPEEQPTFPGGPYMPSHPPLPRLSYAAVGLWIGATATLANATVTANVSNLSGEYTAYVAELTWFPAIYVAANASANAMLIKARAQFSMPNVMRVLLIVYAFAAALQFVVSAFAVAAIVRFISGVVAAGMTTMSIYYLLQAVPPKARAVALVAGLPHLRRALCSGQCGLRGPPSMSISPRGSSSAFRRGPEHSTSRSTALRHRVEWGGGN